MKLKKINILALTRVRNESLIINDTINYLSQIADGIIVFDDDSTDDTKKILKKSPYVIKIIENNKWLDYDRSKLETSHRKELLKEARKINPDWIIYHDADERIENFQQVRNFLLSDESEKYLVLK